MAKMEFEPGTLVTLKIRSEDLPVLFKALGSLTIQAGEILHAMVKAQAVAAALTNTAQTKEALKPKAAPDQNTQTKTEAVVKAVKDALVEDEPESATKPETEFCRSE